MRSNCHGIIAGVLRETRVEARIKNPGAFLYIVEMLARVCRGRQFNGCLSHRQLLKKVVPGADPWVIEVLPEDYPWSSYAAYTGKTKSPAWLTTDRLLQYFGRRPSSARHAYRAFVEAKTGGMQGSPLKEAVASSILGSAAFRDDIREKYLGGRKKDRDVPALGALSRVRPEEIMEKVGGEFQGQPGLARKVGIYLSHRYGGLSLREIVRHFGVGESAVSQASRRFQTTLDDRELRRRVDNVRRSLNL